jgi:hypothetical protein
MDQTQGVFFIVNNQGEKAGVGDALLDDANQWLEWPQRALRLQGVWGETFLLSR